MNSERVREMKNGERRDVFMRGSSMSGMRESIRRRESVNWPFITVGGVNDISWQ